jgi:hypothetical protein
VFGSHLPRLSLAEPGLPQPRVRVACIYLPSHAASVRCLKLERCLQLACALEASHRLQATPDRYEDLSRFQSSRSGRRLSVALGAKRGAEGVRAGEHPCSRLRLEGRCGGIDSDARRGSRYHQVTGRSLLADHYWQITDRPTGSRCALRIRMRPLSSRRSAT